MSRELKTERAKTQEPKCSTPYGIKGMSRDFHRSNAIYSVSVLNALRHQRYVQPSNPFASAFWHNVLNALRHQRYVQSSYKIPELSFHLTCAQRLTASKVCPGERGGKAQEFSRSAQRLTASKVCPGNCLWKKGRNYWVLNALRHQRYVQQWAADLGKRGQRCSTPYGIKGMSSFFRICLRLDSFRGCSTPYGIKGMSRAISASPISIQLRAQRLTASKVCPGKLPPARPEPRRRAQRLTASKVCPDGKEKQSLGATRCSTPYGIKGMSRTKMGSSFLSIPVLNALRHQRYVQVPAVTPFASQVGAQRLTASKVCPDGTFSLSGCKPNVLNALRHQRYVQPRNQAHA